MEQGRTGPRGGDTATLYPLEVHSAQNNNERFEKQKKDFIYICVHDIGIELMMATGGADLTYDNLVALKLRGYIDYSPDEIFDSHFVDLEDLNADIRYGYEQRLEEIASLERHLQAEIETSILPAELFKKVDFVAVKGVSKQRTLKNGDPAFSKDIGVIRDEEVDFNERLSRYAKYALAKKLLGAVRDEVSEQRLAGIALGILLNEASQNRGRKVSSYQSEIHRASGQRISQADVELAAEELGVYDYIYPQSRKQYLRELASVKDYSVLEYFYDAESRVVIVLGRKALSEFISEEGREYLEYLRQYKRLLIGSAAVAAYASGTARGSIHSLGTLLRNGPPKNLEHQHIRTMDLNRDDFLRIGRWFNQVVDPPGNPRDRQLNEEVFMNAKRLGIGFSIQRGSRFLNEFGSMTKYYAALGEGRTHRKAYKDFNRQEAIDALAQLAQSLGRRPTYVELIEAHLQNPAIPNPSTINRISGEQDDKAGIALLMDDAGIPPYRQNWSREDCLLWGVAHIKRTGKEPREKDVDLGSRNRTVAGRRTFRNHFGSFDEFKRQARTLYYQDEETVIKEKLAV